MQPRISFVLAILGCALSTGAWAGFRADFASQGGGASDALSRIELSGNHLRTDAGNVSMLFDAGSGKMIVLMHDQKQYMDMAKVMETAGAAMAAASSALANLPPAQRAMIEQQMGSKIPGMGGAPISVSMTPTGASEQVAGHACKVYKTSVSGRHVSDSCLAKAGDIGISAADQATMRRAFDKLKAMTAKATAGMIQSPLSGMPTDKFPVRITEYGSNGKAEHSSVLKSLTSTGINPGDFAIPAGYTEQEMSGFGH